MSPQYRMRFSFNQARAVPSALKARVCEGVFGPEHARLAEILSDLAFVDVSGRIAHTLLDLCKEPDAMTHPDGMQIKITRQEIGRIVGCSREMAGRVLKTLEEQGLVFKALKSSAVNLPTKVLRFS